MESTLDLEWFDICADELLLGESQERVCTDQAPVSETSIGQTTVFIINSKPTEILNQA
jgi:hypothetical protein